MQAGYLSLLIVVVLFCHMVNFNHRIRPEFSFSLSFAQINWELGVSMHFSSFVTGKPIASANMPVTISVGEANRRWWRLVAECIQPLLPP
jgi:hypothetical protein